MHHLHPKEEQAKLVGREGKPEGYYFPPQLKRDIGQFSSYLLWLEPGTTKKTFVGALIVGTRATTGSQFFEGLQA